VYLGYDLLHLERYDELLALTNKYEEVMPKEPTLPLLAGYVHKHNRDLDQPKRHLPGRLSVIPSPYRLGEPRIRSARSAKRRCGRS